MKKNAMPSGSGSAWILVLTILVVVAGLLLVLTVRRRTSDGSENTRSQAAAPHARGMQRGSEANASSGNPDHSARQRQLMQHQRRMRQGLNDGLVPGASSGAGDRGAILRDGRERGGRAAPTGHGAGGHDSRMGSAGAEHARGEGDGEDHTAEEAEEEEEEDHVHWPVNREGIQGAIRDRIAEIKECYEGWLFENPELQGRVVVSFAIEAGEDGAARIREAGIHGSDLEHSHLERCILVMVESLQFEPPHSGRVVVRYPFVFSSR